MMAQASSSGSRHEKGTPVGLRLPSLIESDWERPTFGEFVERLEHQFGLGADAEGLELAGLRRDEPLTPEEIRALCAELGVPPEDFDVEP